MKAGDDEGKTREIDDVLDRLRAPRLERDTISLLVTRLIELRYPDKRFEFASESEIRILSADGNRGSIYLENLWAECEQSPEERVEIIERYVRVVIPDVSETRTDFPSLGNVVPLVRESVYSEFVAEKDRSLVTRHFIADLWIIFAADLPESTITLTGQAVLDMQVDSSELLRVATKNVERLVSEMEFSPYGECFTIACSNLSYASSTLLLPYVWEQAANLVIGDVVVAVPAKDTVLFTGSGNGQGLKEIREAADYVVRTGHHTISRTLLRWVEGSWVLLS